VHLALTSDTYAYGTFLNAFLTAIEIDAQASKRCRCHLSVCPLVSQFDGVAEAEASQIEQWRHAHNNQPMIAAYINT